MSGDSPRSGGGRSSGNGSAGSGDRDARRGAAGEVQEAIEDRFGGEPGPADRVLFYVALAMLGGVALAEMTGHMELVEANADLLAVVFGITGMGWMPRRARVGVIRVGWRGHPTVRRDEHPAGFWALWSFYLLCYVGLVVGGTAHRLGWLEL